MIEENPFEADRIKADCIEVDLRCEVIEYRWSNKETGEVIFAASATTIKEMPDKLLADVIRVGLTGPTEIEVTAFMKINGLKPHWSVVGSFDMESYDE